MGPATNVSNAVHASSVKNTPVDNDEFGIVDSENSNFLARVTWATIKAQIKTYYDSVTSTLTNKTLTSPVINTPTGIVKGDVGLGNVDNTSDVAKPVSAATQIALNLKAPLASPAFTGTPTGITKAHVGLGNADNTSDANKPVSTAQAVAINHSSRIANNFVAVIGESISGFGNAGELYPPLLGGASWDHVCVGSMGRIRTVANWSVGGSLLPAQLSVQVPQVLAMTPRPGACVVQVGTGDLGLSVSFASMKTDWLSIVNALHDGGVIPIVVTCTPNDFAADYDATDKWNRYVKSYAATRNWPVLDHNAALAGPDGHFTDASYTSDTLHLTGKGHRIMGQADLANGICDLFPPNSQYLTARRTGDTTNVFSGSGLNRGLFTTNTGGVGTGLTGIGGATKSIVAPDPVDDLMGNWQRIAGAGGAAVYLTTGWSVGDVLILAARVRTTGIETGGTNFGVHLLASRNTGTWTQNGLNVNALVAGLYTVPADMEGLLISAPLTVLTNTDLLLLNMSIGTITGSGTPTLDVGELTVHNLTTGGWAA